ncbi:MAG TPA: carboxypeptidase-like regulatory domain-containing protein, partial [Flavilitoribacter sp.]|nr:carboxypeptidase-like regulatory domain-containing protein [Flavilitoribacter sp.]
MGTFTANHMARRWLTASLWLLSVVCLSAQMRTISGTVVSSEKEPLIGATILIDNAPDRGTVTDIDGNFSIQAATGEKLRISYTGYEPLLAEVTAESRYSLVLSST